MLATGGAVGLRQFVRLRPVHPALGGEEQDPVVRGAHEEVPDDVVLFETGTLHTFTAALLAAVEIGLRPLGIAGFGDGDHHVFARDEVLVGYIPVCGNDFRASLVRELLDDLGQLVAHDGALTLRLGENVLVVGDLDLDLRQLVDDLLPFQSSEPAQLHRQDGVGLDLVHVEQLDQTGTRQIDGLGPADQRDDLVKCVKGFDQTAQDVRTLFGLPQPVAGAPDDDVDLMLDVQADHLVQAQRSRNTVHDREHVHAETGLQLAVLVEVVQHHLGHGVTSQGDHDLHADTVRRLVVDPADALELSLVHLFGDRQDHVVGIHLVRQLGDDEGGGTLVLFDPHHASHTDAAPAGGVRVADALAADNQSGGWEVGSLDAFHAGFEGALLVGLVVVECPEDGVGDLTEIVRRDVGGHTHRDAARPVDEEVRYT